MAYEMKEATGSLFKNTRKETENHPDYNGKVLVGGVEYYLDAWLKEGAKGKWMSLSLKPVKKDTPAVAAVRKATTTKTDDDFEDAPF